MCFMYEPHSKDSYDDYDDTGSGYPGMSGLDSLLFPVYLLGAFLLICLAPVLLLLCLLGFGIHTIYTRAKAFVKTAKHSHLALIMAAILVVEALVCGFLYLQIRSLPSVRNSGLFRATALPTTSMRADRPTTADLRPPAGAGAPSASPHFAGTPIPSHAPTPDRTARIFPVVVDDFETKPGQGQTSFFFTRLEGDRGAINDAVLTFDRGQATTTVSDKRTWGGAWMSLNHPIREAIPINLGMILPSQILPAYQSAVTGVTAQIAAGTQGRIFRLELKDHGALRWQDEVILSGSRQVVAFDLPALGEVNELVWVLDRAAPGDFVVMDSLAFTATTQITDTATAAFVWSLAQLLSNADPASGLVRDKARDASGEFDAVPATGGLAAATALAAQLGVISHEDAVQIVSRIADTLLNDLPRFEGLWPHWVKTSVTGEPIIVPGTEHSSVDSAVAAISLLTAQQALGLDTSGTEAMIRDIGWSKLVTPRGISHGYTDAGELIPYAWDSFSGEAFLVELAYASATGRVVPMAYPSPPTFNGSGFLDELAFLWAPPPSGLDVWGNDWRAYRSAAAETQIAYFRAHYPTSCLARFGLFGLSAAEGPDPSRVSPADLYQAGGVGGRFRGPNDGSALWGAPIAVPHYAAMIASLRPKEATAMWDWLIQQGYVSPLTNVESLMFAAGADCTSTQATWNSLKGSWNLVLQTLGWGRYLVERRGETSVLWQAVTENPFLRSGYRLLAPGGASSAPTMAPTLTPMPRPQVPLTPFAVYAPPSPSETPIAAKLDTNLPACAGKPLYLWRSPGRYEYERGGLTFRTIAPAAQPRAPTVPQCPDVSNGWEPVTQSFGDRLSEPPVSGVVTHLSCQSPTEVWISIGGTEAVTTTLGVFQALRIEGSQGYDIYGAVGRIGAFIPHIEDQYRASEWWVCGYGLVRVKASHSYEDQGFPHSEKNFEAALVSVMPFAYYESAVRVILADMQLAGIVDAYRARTSDANVREALRRWDAGVRVVNSNRFERKIIDGQWLIVHAGTKVPVGGMDLALNDRPWR